METHIVFEYSLDGGFPNVGVWGVPRIRILVFGVYKRGCHLMWSPESLRGALFDKSLCVALKPEPQGLD